jgi:hypothetical protein
MTNMLFVRQKIGVSALPGALIAKWGSDALGEGFVALPKRLLRCLNRIFEGPDAMERLMVVMAVVDYLRPNLTRGPSQEYLGFLAGLTPDRVATILSELKAEGLVTVERKAEGELDIGISGLQARIQALADVE